MKHRMWAAGIALAVLAAAGLGGLAAAAQQVPFSGSLEGSADISGFPNVVLHATGTASQLGQYTFTMPHVVSPPTGSGTFEFVASNGDTLVGTETGSATPTSTPDVLFIVENLTITGGTGRFAGATGSFTIERLYNRVTLVTAGSFTGTISAPGAGS